MRRQAKIALAVSAIIALSGCDWNQWVAFTQTKQTITRAQATALTTAFRASDPDYPEFCGYYEQEYHRAVVVADCDNPSVHRHEEAHGIAFDAGYYVHTGPQEIAPEEKAADCLMQAYWGIYGIYWNCPPAELANARRVLTSIGVSR